MDEFSFNCVLSGGITQVKVIPQPVAGWTNLYAYSIRVNGAYFGHIEKKSGKYCEIGISRLSRVDIGTIGRHTDEFIQNSNSQNEAAPDQNDRR